MRRVASDRLFRKARSSELNEESSLLLKLLDEYGVRLHALLVKVTLRKDAAEELLQELFIKLHFSATFRQASQPERYLFRSAINIAMDWRARNRRIMEPLGFQPSSADKPPADKVIEKEEVEQVMSAIDQLAAPDRELVILRYLNGNTYEELAAHFDSTPHRIRGLCSKALGRLRRNLSSHSVTTGEANVERR